jgi:hypothetical protein
MLGKKRKSLLILLLAIGFVAAPGYLSFADDSPPTAQADNKNAASTAGPAPIDGTKFHALLVGCTKYDNLKPSKSLRGPSNDVDLMRRFFTEQLKLPAQSIVVLSEAEAAVHGETSRPTRANIEREIQKLIDTAKEGDQVVLLLAGHGGQQPERKDPDPTYLKPDGLDQMFLPCDCGQWNGKKWCVEQAIADYEMRSWCKQITRKKARLWVVLDACCSGWILKARSVEVKRAVSSEELGIPYAALAQSKAAAEARRPPGRGAAGGEGRRVDDSTSADGPEFNFGPQSPDYVGIYAAQRDESEMEMPMPYNAEPDQPQRVQGLLTYAIIDILSRASRPITYGELGDLIRQRYPQWGRTMGPTPVVEGLAEDRVVMGVQRWPGRSRRRWRKDDGGSLTVNQGSVEGLTPGSILALYPAIDQPNSESILGYAKVGHCELLESNIKLVKHNDMPVPNKGALPAGGTFEVAWTDYGSLRLRVAVDMNPVHTDASPAPSVAADAAASGTLRNLGLQLGGALSETGSLCDLVNDERTAQWVVQMRDGKLNLLSKDVADIRGKCPPEAPRFSISEDDAVPEIVRDVTRIARAQNLLSLTKADQQDAADGGAAFDDPSRPNVELKILRYKTKTDPVGTDIDLAKAALVLVPGDYIGWRMTNLGKFDVAVSLLYIDAGFGIHALFPRAGSGTENMLPKNGGTRSTLPAKITADPIGNEYVVLIAVPRKAEQQSPDFSFLQQATLPKARGARDPENPGLNSPLGRLLKNAMYGEGGTRGMDSNDATQAHLMLQSWRVSAGAH